MGIPVATLVQPGVVCVNIPFRRQVDWTFRVLLRSDAHHDNPKCRQDIEQQHLDEALACGAGILDFGDLFCAMQGKYDRRSSKDDIREEHRCGDYLDALVRTAADFYEPYASNIWMLGVGNHETSILDRSETNLVDRLAQTLRDRTNASVCTGGYRGFVVFKFSDGPHRVHKHLYYEHGSGGGGPVTKGVIQHNRRAAAHVADVYVSGHIHESWMMKGSVSYVDDLGVWKVRPTLHLSCAGYKDEFGPMGYHNINCRPSKPLGAWWLEFGYSHKLGITTRAIEATEQ